MAKSGHSLFPHSLHRFSVGQDEVAQSEELPGSLAAGRPQTQQLE